jgi:hypothetical protein
MSNLQLSPVEVNHDYLQEWNVTNRDFVCLTQNGQMLNNCLYRVGGFDGDITQNYFMLLKYVESVYDFDFIKKCYPNKNKKQLEALRKHLDACWCIIDKNGVEKKVFNAFETPYLKKGSCLYSLNSKYYNIETGYCYCQSSNYLESSNFVFLENHYDKDLSKRGIMQINKKTGEWFVFP